MPQVKANVLIVEDDASVRMSLEEAFVAVGYGVRAANGGFEALAEILKGVPDIVLSNLHIKGMSGYHLLAVVTRRYPAVRAIAMSNAFSGSAVPPGVTADAFIGKGGTIEEFLRAMEAPLSRVGPREDNARRSVEKRRGRAGPGAAC